MEKSSPVLKYRIESIDILRGLVMLIMAIDHARDLFHLGGADPTNLASTTPILFFTRWITHFCAPTFVFLSGISACLAGTRRTGKQLGIFLLKRGAWLLIVEVALITLAITGNPLYNVVILQVIWAIGASMILLGLLILFRTPLVIITAIGIIIFSGHNMLDYVSMGDIGNSVVWRLFFSAAGFNAFVPLGNNRFILIAYALIPWTGVMLLGYSFGSIYKSSVNAFKRRKTLLLTGLSLLAIFLVFRYFNIYGDPSPWSVQKTSVLSVISFFNVTKYPCSLLYLSMTLGTALVTLSLIERIKSKFADILIIYGNVPFFYYLCHWYLLRLLTIIVFFASGFKASQIINPKSPFLFAPVGFGFNLLGVYIIWFLVIALLYLPCRWFSRYKKTHQQWWLSYL